MKVTTEPKGGDAAAAICCTQFHALQQNIQGTRRLPLRGAAESLSRCVTTSNEMK